MAKNCIRPFSTYCSSKAISVHPSVFVEPWWLDAVAPDAWDEVSVERGGKTIGRLPFVFEESRLGLKLHMPRLTQCLGPYVSPGDGKESKRNSNHKDISTELISKLPAFCSFRQNFHYSYGSWLPWHWKGFKQTTRYTYVLPDIDDENVLWDGIAGNIRGDIRKARKKVNVEPLEDGASFFDLNELVFRRQNLPVPYRRDFVERLDDACQLKKRREILVARDGSGRLHAGVYIVWNDESAHYLMGGGDPELRSSGATSLCMWEAIKRSSKRTQRFDFEGSMMEPIERYFRAFGAIPLPYHSVSKQTVLGSLSAVRGKALARVQKLLHLPR